MKYVAFFRNLNLGRPNCPTKTQLEEAFMAAGAESASSFLVNGTLVYSVKAGTRARKVLAQACATLRVGCGLAEPAYVRTLAHLAELVALDPFAGVERGSVYECCASFLHSDSVELPAAPFQSRRGDVEVLRLTGGEAFCVSRKIGNTPGSPNAFLEKLLGSPVTTRSWNTVLRLVHKHA
ncbi:MAG TPA: DUF1697 domain-containing protein [Albitalea sp.]|nr:DUF1697 domain-containing protein [Albitalea sp.]